MRHLTTMLICLCVAAASNGQDTQLQCLQQFSMYLDWYDSEIVFIQAQPYFRQEYKLIDLCNALKLLSATVVQDSCFLNGTQFSLLERRQQDLRSFGVTDCWATTEYPVSVPGLSTPLPTTKPPSPLSAQSNDTNSTLVSEMNIEEENPDQSECPLKVKNCFLKFYVDLYRREEFMNSTCDAIESLADCLLAFPECEFHEDMRSQIEEHTETLAEFQWWEKGGCRSNETKDPTAVLVNDTALLSDISGFWNDTMDSSVTTSSPNLTSEAAILTNLSNTNYDMNTMALDTNVSNFRVASGATNTSIDTNISNAVTDGNVSNKTFKSVILNVTGENDTSAITHENNFPSISDINITSVIFNTSGNANDSDINLDWSTSNLTAESDILGEITQGDISPLERESDILLTIAGDHAIADYTSGTDMITTPSDVAISTDTPNLPNTTNTPITSSSYSVSEVTTDAVTSEYENFPNTTVSHDSSTQSTPMGENVTSIVPNETTDTANSEQLSTDTIIGNRILDFSSQMEQNTTILNTSSPMTPYDISLNISSTFSSNTTTSNTRSSSEDTTLSSSLSPGSNQATTLSSLQTTTDLSARVTTDHSASVLTETLTLRTSTVGPTLVTQEPCGLSRFTCQNGGCIPLSLLCNAQDNCGDNSDEIECERPQKKVIMEMNQALKTLGCQDAIERCIPSNTTVLLTRSSTLGSERSRQICSTVRGVIRCIATDNCHLTDSDRVTVTKTVHGWLLLVISPITCQ